MTNYLAAFRTAFLNVMRTVLPRPSNTRIVTVPRSEAGVTVTHDTAMQVAAVYSCVRVIAESISSLSWHVFERRTSGGQDRKESHRVEGLLNFRSNPEMASSTVTETLLGHALLWGNAYCEIEKDEFGRILNLWPLSPERVQPDRTPDGALFYTVHNERGGRTHLDPEFVFHLKGLGFDGIMGYSVVSQAAKTIGLALALQENGAALFKNGGLPLGVLTTDKFMTDEAIDQTHNEWTRRYGGANPRDNVAILTAGQSFQTISMPMTDLQWLESRAFQVTEIARWFRVQPHKIMDLENATFSNISEQNQEFVQDTLMPWITRLESEANYKLFGRQERRRVFSKFNLNSLLRGNTEQRAAFYRTMRDLAVLSVNEIRALEDLNPIGTDGDKRLVQLALTTLDKVGEDKEPAQVGANGMPPGANGQQADDDEAQPDADDAQADDEPRQPSAGLRAVLVDSLNRCLRREKAVLTEAGDDIAKLAAANDKHDTYVIDLLSKPLEAIFDAIGSEPPDRIDDVVMLRRPRAAGADYINDDFLGLDYDDLGNIAQAEADAMIETCHLVAARMKSNGAD